MKDILSQYDCLAWPVESLMRAGDRVECHQLNSVLAHVTPAVSDNVTITLSIVATDDMWYAVVDINTFFYFSDN